MPKFFVCALILQITFVGADYDFQDSDFNKLLFDDLMEIDDETEPKKCYREKGNDDMTNAQELVSMEEIMKNCIAEVRGENNDVCYDPLNCDGIQSIRRLIVCTAEYVAKKLDLLAENGDWKRDALLSQARKFFGTTTIDAGVLEKDVDKCLNELKASKERKTKDDSKNITCNPYPLEFHHCFWRDFVQGCPPPADLKIDIEICIFIRKRLARDVLSQFLRV